jgi:hypothetical protein
MPTPRPRRWWAAPAAPRTCGVAGRRRRASSPPAPGRPRPPPRPCQPWKVASTGLPSAARWWSAPSRTSSSWWRGTPRPTRSTRCCGRHRPTVPGNPRRHRRAAGLGRHHQGPPGLHRPAGPDPGRRRQPGQGDELVRQRVGLHQPDGPGRCAATRPRHPRQGLTDAGRADRIPVPRSTARLISAAGARDPPPGPAPWHGSQQPIVLPHRPRH